MVADTVEAKAGRTLWRAVLNPSGDLSGDFTADPPYKQALYLNGLLTPALAAHFPKPLEDRTGLTLTDADAVRKSVLANRLNGGIQRKWAAEIAGTGIPVVFMKGFAFAHSLYGDSDVRTIGDIDLLVGEADLHALLDFLTARGFRFESLPMPAWGFISDASFMPMMSETGDCNIDVHVQPDCYPAYRSITARDVFDRATDFKVGETTLRMPSIEHSMLLCLTNAAKDKFGPFSARKLMDIFTMLRHGMEIDWDEIRRLAVAGRFLKPAGVAFALLRELGMSDTGIPDDLIHEPRGIAAGPFNRLVQDYARFFSEEPPPLRVLERELTLCTEPGVALYNTIQRVKGLVRKKDGLPAGYASR